MQDCGGRWRRVVNCIMNNAEAEPQAVPVLPLGWLNDRQSRKNRWLAVHASGSRACHILRVYFHVPRSKSPFYMTGTNFEIVCETMPNIRGVKDIYSFLLPLILIPINILDHPLVWLYSIILVFFLVSFISFDSFSIVFKVYLTFEHHLPSSMMFWYGRCDVVTAMI